MTGQQQYGSGQGKQAEQRILIGQHVVKRVEDVGVVEVGGIGREGMDVPGQDPCLAGRVTQVAGEGVGQVRDDGGEQRQRDHAVGQQRQAGREGGRGAPARGRTRQGAGRRDGSVGSKRGHEPMLGHGWGRRQGPKWAISRCR